MTATPGPTGIRRIVPVVVPQLPVRDFLDLQSHFDDVVRELQLIEVGGKLGQDVPARLATLAEMLDRGRTSVRNESRRQAMQALDAGLDRFDLSVKLFSPVVSAARAMSDLFDEVDRCSETGLMLIEVASEPIRRVLARMIEHLERIDRSSALDAR